MKNKYLLFFFFMLAHCPVALFGQCAWGDSLKATLSRLRTAGIDSFFLFASSMHSDSYWPDLARELPERLYAPDVITDDGDTIQVINKEPDSILVDGADFGDCAGRVGTYLFFKSGNKYSVLKFDCCNDYDAMQLTDKIIITNLFKFKTILREKYRFYGNITKASSHPATYGLLWFINGRELSKQVSDDELNQQKFPGNKKIIAFNDRLVSSILIRSLESFIQKAEAGALFKVKYRINYKLKIKNPYKKTGFLFSSPATSRHGTSRKQCINCKQQPVSRSIIRPAK